jgi:predicted nucleic acid-binding protein
VNRVLLDTSAVIASADSLRLASDAITAISVLTIGELSAGVRLASNPEVRAIAAFEPLPVDETVAYRYGELLAIARAGRRSTKATDLLIIATASAGGRMLVTLDDAQASLARAASVAVQR